MAKTVVAMFNSVVEAQRAKHDLVNEGYAAENIRVVSNDAPGAAGTAPGTSESEYVSGSGSGYTSGSGSGYTSGSGSGYTSGSGSGYTSGSTTSGSHETGVMASIKNFFSSLTGADEADQEYYTQGVSRGGAILSVTAPDDRVDALQATLRRYGADVEQGAATGTTTGAGLTGTGTTRETAATGQTRTGNATEGTSIPIV